MDDIVVEQVYAYTVEQVWEALTDPAAVADWLMPGEFRAVVGHRVRLRCEPTGAFDGAVDLEVLEVSKPRRLSYSWKTSDMRAPTIVTYTLLALPGGGTRLRLEHTGFSAENGRATHPLFKQGWVGKLREKLAATLAKRGAAKGDALPHSIRKPPAEHPVVPHEEWIAERRALLAKEKEFSRAREALAQQRRALPWERVEKSYQFEGPDGTETLADLFGKRSQLVVYQFMFAPEWDAGCPHCSFWADHYDGMLPHLAQRDVSFVAISRAPLARIETFRKRMGWRFKWVSSAKTDYNYDFQASFRPEEIRTGTLFYNYAQVPMDMTDREGISVFLKERTGAIVHTYSTYARGIDMVNATYQFLDLVPKGRDENPDSPQDWVRHHDRYDD